MPKKRKGLVSSVQDLLGTVYGRTYGSSIEDKRVLDNISSSIDNSINSIINSNKDKNGVNLSRLYSRIDKASGGTSIDGEDITKKLEDMFSDQSSLNGLMDLYMDNKYIKDLDHEVNSICKYMPKLEDALEVKKDAILSSDVFSKEFMSINNLSNSGNDRGFDEKVKNMIDEYNLTDLLETIIWNTLKYGESFIYITSYNKAIKSVLKQKNPNEIVKVNESGISVNNETEFKKEFKTLYETSSVSVSMEVGEISSLLEDTVNLDLKADGQSILRDIRDEDLEYIDGSNDGLIDVNKEKLGLKGCVIRTLKRENVVPLYIDEVCFGYYHIETSNNDLLDNLSDGKMDPFSKMRSGSKMGNDKAIKDELLKNITSGIVKNIDSKFIRSNPELKKEIYTILKHNLVNDQEGQGLFGDVRVSFIPPTDIIHFAYNKDEETHRGLSDLHFSMIPAKLYSCMYISNTIGVLTRSQDKRAYFVRQGVDTNISKLLLNTINQIKKSNFGMREINNMNNMLNITGRYNDYIIPVGPSGERPIDFEIIPGQDIDTKPELLEDLESMAVDPIGVPIELIDMSRSIDYSRQLTVGNGKFARHILKRQLATQNMFSDLLTRAYNYYYDANDKLECMLAPPSHLTVSNINELLRTTQDAIEVLSDLHIPDSDRDSEYGKIFKRNLMKHYISSFINWDNVNTLLDKAKIEASKLELDKDDDSSY